MELTSSTLVTFLTEQICKSDILRKFHTDLENVYRKPHAVQVPVLVIFVVVFPV